ncbi:MAG: hypothetical protein V7K67_12785 [Nostoc sp.]|uniref:hypothetical protein n=1 Tax=Nostoc sp. TaxID=1180 RepID=UPI002FF249E2
MQIMRISLNTVQLSFSSFSSFASFAVACGKPLRVYVKKRILALTEPYWDIAWRDEKISVILPRTNSEFSTEKLAISSGGRFVVVANQVQLRFQGNYLQLVANLWERWGFV